MGKNSSDLGNKPIIVIVGFIASLLTLCTFFTGIVTIQDIKIDLPNISLPKSPANPTASSESLSANAIPSTLDWDGSILFVYNDTITKLYSNGEVVSLFVAPKNSQVLRWSPDGRYIAYIGKSIDGDLGIFIMNSDGTNAQMIFTLSAIDTLEDIYWFSDSKKILFAGQHSGFRMIDINSKLVTDLGSCNNLDVWPRAITIDKNNNYIGFMDFITHGGVIVRPVSDANCSVWLQAQEINQIGPLSFTEESSELIVLNSNILYRVIKPGTSASRLIEIDRIKYGGFGSSMAWSPNHRYLAIQGVSSIHVFDEVTGYLEEVFSVHLMGDDIDSTSLGWLP